MIPDLLIGNNFSAEVEVHGNKRAIQDHFLCTDMAKTFLVGS